MGCGNCSSGGCGSGGAAGCKNNGMCGTSGCNKFNTFNWLSDIGIDAPPDRFDIMEVRFKGGRKAFYRNIHQLNITTGDPVIVETKNGWHLGFVSLQGELVRLQMKKKKVENNEEIPNICRIATDDDMDRFEQSKARELPALYRTREIIKEQDLRMKLSDVEFQADNCKATFYYSADDRVDFRELIKKLASEFKIKVEMKQISLRQEAGRVGGIGVCGRELCCSTWLNEFKSVSTAAARYQNLSINPSKLSGQCGRLKCCLNYELETYMEALNDIPVIEEPLLTQQGAASVQKTDIFRKIIWFAYDEDSVWTPVSVNAVKEIIKLNQQGIKPNSLDPEDIKETEEDEAHMNTSINSDLETLDSRLKKRNKKRKRKKEV